jgi:GNAT superfamily N-acetyltransferase
VQTWQAAYEHVFGAERLAALDINTREERWRQRIAERGNEAVVVAEDHGFVIGFASYGGSRDHAGEGELYAIYTLPEAWGSGAGPALMGATLAGLGERGFVTASLWVLDDNPRARRFYEREGWTDDGGRREEEFLGVPITEVRYRIKLG